MSRDKVAVDVMLTDLGMVIALNGVKPSSMEVAESMALALHERALEQLGPSPEPCTYEWYAYDGDEDHGFEALKRDMEQFVYHKAAELIAAWQKHPTPVVAAHFQRVVAPLLN